MKTTDRTSPCIFCGEGVAMEGEGCNGVFIGEKAICIACLKELKNALSEL